MNIYPIDNTSPDFKQLDLESVHGTFLAQLFVKKVKVNPYILKTKLLTQVVVQPIANKLNLKHPLQEPLTQMKNNTDILICGEFTLYIVSGTHSYEKIGVIR